MSDAIMSQCAACARFRSPLGVAGREEPFCAAFPDRIPDVIYDMQADHRQPYPGDHGLRWLSGGEEYPDWVFDLLRLVQSLSATQTGNLLKSELGHLEEWTGPVGKAVYAELLKVGPKGYIHGWILVGVPLRGNVVNHPDHGRGRITRVGSRTTGVTFDSGAYHAFEHERPLAGAVRAGDFRARPTRGRRTPPAPPAPPPPDPLAGTDKPKAKDLADAVKQYYSSRSHTAAEINAFDRKITAAANRIYGGTFGSLTAKVHTSFYSSSWGGQAELIFQGHVLDDTGAPVGKFTRKIVAPNNRDIHAVHAYLEIRPTVRGQGFANGFNANAETWYRDSGLSNVVVHADMSVGGYTWARQGFDFQSTWTRDTFIQRLDARANTLAANAARATDAAKQAKMLAVVRDARNLVRKHQRGEHVSAFEISQVGRPARSRGGRTATWLGKQIMLGSDWMGVKYLT